MRKLVCSIALGKLNATGCSQPSTPTPPTSQLRTFLQVPMNHPRFLLKGTDLRLAKLASSQTRFNIKEVNWMWALPKKEMTNVRQMLRTLLWLSQMGTSIVPIQEPRKSRQTGSRFQKISAQTELSPCIKIRAPIGRTSVTSSGFCQQRNFNTATT